MNMNTLTINNKNDLKMYSTAFKEVINELLTDDGLNHIKKYASFGRIKPLPIDNECIVGSVTFTDKTRTHGKLYRITLMGKDKFHVSTMIYQFYIEVDRENKLKSSFVCESVNPYDEKTKFYKEVLMRSLIPVKLGKRKTSKEKAYTTKPCDHPGLTINQIFSWKPVTFSSNVGLR